MSAPGKVRDSILKYASVPHDNDRVMREREGHPLYERYLLAVDPGDEHVGVAAFGLSRDGWENAWSCEMTPDEFTSYLSMMAYLGRFDVIVVEEWRLFPQAAPLLVGSDMPTSQLIGVIKYIHRQTKMGTMRWPGPEVELYFQSPQIKKPTRSLLQARKMSSLAKWLKVPNDHATDAELHGWYHIIKTLEEPVHQRMLEGLKKRGIRRLSDHRFDPWSPVW